MDVETIWKRNAAEVQSIRVGAMAVAFYRAGRITLNAQQYGLTAELWEKADRYSKASGVLAIFSAT